MGYPKDGYKRLQSYKHSKNAIFYEIFRGIFALQHEFSRYNTYFMAFHTMKPFDIGK